MKTTDFPARPGRLMRFLLLVATFECAALPLVAGSTNWNFKADLTLKESYDSNVYLQDLEPDRVAVPRAVSPFQESFVTAVTAGLTVGWKPCADFKASMSYAPEAAFYHDEPSEDYVAHRAQVNVGGQVAAVPWQMVNALTWVDGSGEGLYFGAPGGAPAIGGIPIRDRRDQFVYRGKANATLTKGKWFLRPVFTAYVHNFQTVQKDCNPGSPDQGYENYVDRNEVSVGGDIGWRAGERTSVFAGYRYGKETQGRLVGSPYHYDATYHRPFVGIEGQPVDWIRLACAVGPDIHHTTGQPAPGFERDYTTVWADAVITFLFGERNELALTWKQNTQPAFASCSVYDDITYDALFTHRFDSRWSVGGGFRVYGGDWMAPVARDDWIYTPRANINYHHDRHLSAELAYSYDWVESKVPSTEGREFTRHLVWLAVKWGF